MEFWVKEDDTVAACGLGSLQGRDGGLEQVFDAFGMGGSSCDPRGGGELEHMGADWVCGFPNGHEQTFCDVARGFRWSRHEDGELLARGTTDGIGLSDVAPYGLDAQLNELITDLSAIQIIDPGQVVHVQQD